MVRRKKSQVDPSSPIQSEYQVQMELEIQALSVKNKELVKCVTKLQQEKTQLQKQINGLQEEYFKLNSKYVNLRNIFMTIDGTIKICFPKMAEIVNLLAKIMHLCSVGSAVSSLNKDPQTLTVKPHMVNGTVIKNPTINLSRFTNTDSAGSPTAENPNNRSVTATDNSQNPLAISPRSNRSQNFVPDTRPSTSRGFDENRINFITDTRPSTSRGLDDNFVTNTRPSTSRGFDENRRVSFAPETKTNNNDVNEDNSILNEDINMDDEMDEIEKNGRLSRYHRRLENLQNSELELDLDDSNVNNLNEQEDDEDPNEDEGYCQRLMTIGEESGEYNSINEGSPQLPQFANQVREIRIYLSPLRVEHTNMKNISEMNFSERTSSVLGEPSSSVLDPNSTILNDSQGNSNQTIKFMDSSINNYSINSPKSTRGRFSSGENDWSSLHVRREVKKLNSTGCSFMDSLSVHTPHTSQQVDDTLDTKLLTMQSLGLSPNSPKELTSSTPIVPSPRTRLRISKKHKSSDKSLNYSPITSNVTKRKGSSDKLAQVIIQRLSLNGTNSTSETITALLNTNHLTSAKEIKSNKKEVSMKSEQSTSTADVSQQQDNKQKIKKRKVTIVKKGKENRKQPMSPIQKIKSSPRPKRAARPTVLTETSLKKKMRRSR